jgi:ectoine hydroxylase-related dioxygenase (phytanoyl-CoA dioxygenase family)
MFAHFEWPAMTIPEFVVLIAHSPAAEVAAALMRSEAVQLFHDHVLLKEPGTSKPTPWHQDSPYYFVQGSQTVSFWTVVEPVTEATLRCVAGSHLWPKPVLPTRWQKEDAFYPDEDAYIPVPDPDAEAMQVLEWDLEPGDAVAFDFRCLHGARGNRAGARRRAFSLRLLGDDARFVERHDPGSDAPLRAFRRRSSRLLLWGRFRYDIVAFSALMLGVVLGVVPARIRRFPALAIPPR